MIPRSNRTTINNKKEISVQIFFYQLFSGGVWQFDSLGISDGLYTDPFIRQGSWQLRLITHSCQSEGCGCSPQGWRIQKWRQSRQQQSGTWRTSSPTRLDCRALDRKTKKGGKIDEMHIDHCLSCNSFRLNEFYLEKWRSYCLYGQTLKSKIICTL